MSSSRGLRQIWPVYPYRDDLIRLGHIEGGVAPLLTRDKHALRLDLVG